MTGQIDLIALVRVRDHDAAGQLTVADRLYKVPAPPDLHRDPHCLPQLRGRSRPRGRLLTRSRIHPACPRAGGPRTASGSCCCSRCSAGGRGDGSWRSCCSPAPTSTQYVFRAAMVAQGDVIEAWYASPDGSGGKLDESSDLACRRPPPPAARLVVITTRRPVVGGRPTSLAWWRPAQAPPPATTPSTTPGSGSPPGCSRALELLVRHAGGLDPPDRRHRQQARSRALRPRPPDPGSGRRRSWLAPAFVFAQSIVAPTGWRWQRRSRRGRLIRLAELAPPHGQRPTRGRRHDPAGASW